MLVVLFFILFFVLFLFFFITYGSWTLNPPGGNHGRLDLCPRTLIHLPVFPMVASSPIWTICYAYWYLHPEAR
ncbi:hypothetical protein BGZ63DRAFT_372722 [Mariannaea sp. PMI_226]|nr:hypothetical protein BGZ63DRAFT_372722 [Mariannaea sp. PMI_226]